MRLNFASIDKNLIAKMSDNSIGNKTFSPEKDLDNVSVISDASKISNMFDLSNITVSPKDFFPKSGIRFKYFLNHHTTRMEIINVGSRTKTIRN